jgi:hypothetical protein
MCATLTDDMILPPDTGLVHEYLNIDELSMFLRETMQTEFVCSVCFGCNPHTQWIAAINAFKAAMIDYQHKLMMTHEDREHTPHYKFALHRLTQALETVAGEAPHTVRYCPHCAQ